MKNKFFKVIPVILAVALMTAGCAKTDSNNGSSTNTYTSNVNNSNDNSESIVSGTESSSGNSSEITGSTSSESSPESEASFADNSNEQSETGTLTVYFGDSGSAFTLNLYDNDTAAAIVKHVGTARWQLPIYHFDDYENWEVMQYYDIPSRYEIPSNAEAITSEKAGEVYYSEPNRIVMFYGDAEVSGEYTPVGYFDPTSEFISAVENNPVLEGWGNKIVIIEPGD